jgi:phage/plasmid-associated DNA primase
MVINFVSKFVTNPVAANEFPLDESIQFAVNSYEWATPFLSYLVHILKTGTGLRKLVAPAKVMEYTSEYRNENDAIAKFIDEKIRKVDIDEESEQLDKTKLRREFKTWKDQNEFKMLLPADMLKRMEEKFGKYPVGGWSSIKLNT